MERQCFLIGNTVFGAVEQKKSVWIPRTYEETCISNKADVAVLQAAWSATAVLEAHRKMRLFCLRQSSARFYGAVSHSPL